MIASNRFQIFIFLLVTFILSYGFQLYVIFNGGVSAFGIFMLTGLMWIPAIVSLLIRGWSKSWNDVGFRFGGLRFYSIAFFVPLVLSLISYFLCYFLQIRELKFVESVPFTKIVFQFSLIFILGAFSAFGEELGWRGYLLPKLIQAKWKFPILTSGFIWAAWHLPIVAFGGYYGSESPYAIILTYSLIIIVFNYFISWLRILSGSVWVATIAHASYNFFFQTFWLYLLFKPEGSNAKYWTLVGGDSGIIPTILFFLVFICGYYKLKLRSPADRTG